MFDLCTVYTCSLTFGASIDHTFAERLGLREGPLTPVDVCIYDAGI